MQIEIQLKLDEEDVASLSIEHEENESSFIHEFSRRILEVVSSTTKQMREAAHAIDKVNPFGSIVYGNEAKEESVEK